MTAEELLALLDEHALSKVKKNAWYEAARCWTEYHEAVRAGEPTTVTNPLCDAAWSAEWWWRTVYDAQHQRETAA